MVKVIDIPEDSSFCDFCEKYDIPVMDSQELREIFESSGWGYAARRWRQMQKELRD